MGYRGEDLDLRTPQSWAAGTPDPGAQAEPTPQRGRRSATLAPRNGPIWVDDTVMACCNHAYDVAVAHRSAEVRLEHLLHALTRIDAASEVLEAHGIRDAALRRETATIIASELPATMSNGNAVPRRAAELAEVLRLAAAHAYRRNAPAGVADLLHVFFEMKPELPGLAVLMRHTGRVTAEMPDNTPAMSRPPSYIAEPRYEAPPEPVRDRRSQRPTYRPPEPPRQNTVDSFQNARLDALETAVRNLGLEIADERASFIGLIKEVQRDVGEQRDDVSRHSGGLFDRLQQIETLVSATPDNGEMDRTIERLEGIETLIQQRLGELVRASNALAERLGTLEHAMREQRAAAPPDLSALYSRLDRLEHSVREGAGDAGRHWMGLSDRLKAVDLALQNPAHKIDLNPISNRLDIIEEALLSRDDQPVRDVAAKLAAVEQSIAASRTQAFETHSSLAAEVKALSGAVATQAANAERFQSAIGGRVDGIANLLDRHRGELVQALTGPGEQLGQRLQGVVHLLEARQAETAESNGALASMVKEMEQQFVGQLSAVEQNYLGALRTVEEHHVGQIRGVEQGLVAHIKALEHGLAAQVEKSGALQAGYGRDLADLHDALVKLNANQHTLSGSIDQWRTESAGDLSIVSNRLSSVEREAQRPMQLLASVAADLDSMKRYTVERAGRRSRFLYWLFGTDDWLGASWPDQSKRIEAARIAAQARKA